MVGVVITSFHNISREIVSKTIVLQAIVPWWLDFNRIVALGILQVIVSRMMVSRVIESRSIRSRVSGVIYTGWEAGV